MIIEVSICPKYTPGWGANFNVGDKNNIVVYDGTPTRIQGKGYRELTELRFTLSRNNFSSLIFWANSLRGDLSTSTSTDSFTQLLVNGEVEYVSRTNFTHRVYFERYFSRQEFQRETSNLSSCEIEHILVFSLSNCKCQI